jgi:hypothetical protein
MLTVMGLSPYGESSNPARTQDFHNYLERDGKVL